MSMKTKIKVIKRDERNHQPRPVEEESNQPKESARDMVATVTSWVTEFQQKRREETARAFKSLFTDQTPQPSRMGS
jgi:hypothetical protein